jgi:hypothetical protein
MNFSLLVLSRLFFIQISSIGLFNSWQIAYAISNVGEQSFIDGVMAACEFFEHALDDILTVKENCKRGGGVEGSAFFN